MWRRRLPGRGDDSLLEDGGDELAGTAPRRVEVDEDGLALGEDIVPLGLTAMKLLIPETRKMQDKEDKETGRRG